MPIKRMALYSVAQRCVAVGYHWTATSTVTRSALLWPRLLLPCRHPCTIVPVDIAKKARNRFPQVQYIHFPVAFGNLPPATPLNYIPGVFICFIFNHIIRRRQFDWWAKYNCESLVMRLSEGFLTRGWLRFSGWVYSRCVVRWIGYRLCIWPFRLLYSAIPEKWHDWPKQHSEMVG